MTFIASFQKTAQDDLFLTETDREYIDESSKKARLGAIVGALAGIGASALLQRKNLKNMFSSFNLQNKGVSPGLLITAPLAVGGASLGAGLNAPSEDRLSTGLKTLAYGSAGAGLGAIGAGLLGRSFPRKAVSAAMDSVENAGLAEMVTRGVQGLLPGGLGLAYLGSGEVAGNMLKDRIKKKRQEEEITSL